MNLIETLVLMLILLLIKGFFSGSEIALVSSDKIKMRHKARMGHKGAQIVLDLFKTPDILLGTTLVGTNIATVALTTLGTLLMVEYFGDNGDVYALLIYSPIFLIFGEIVPKSIYQQNSNTIAPVIVRVLRLFSLLFYPIIFIFSRIARTVARMVGVGKPNSSLFITREQMRSIVEMAEMGSHLDAFDRNRIKRAINFSDTIVGQVMTPVPDMLALEQDSSLENAVRLAQSMHFHDIPVYQGNISNIVGMLSIEPWEVLELDLAQQTLLEIIKPALYVTENQYLEELFHLFDQQNCKTAIVVDEFGSTTGIIDKQDLYEEVVGDLESSPEESSRRRYNQKMLFQELGQDSYMIDAKLPIAEVNDILGININATEFYSLGGFMLSHLHHLPKTGESIAECGYSFIIHSMTARAIKTIKVEKIASQ